MYQVFGRSQSILYNIIIESYISEKKLNKEFEFLANPFKNNGPTIQIVIWFWYDFRNIILEWPH